MRSNGVNPPYGPNISKVIHLKVFLDMVHIPSSSALQSCFLSSKKMCVPLSKIHVIGCLFPYPTEAGMARWWERLPPTYVTCLWFPEPASYVGWVCCWFSPLFREVFLRVLWLSPFLKNQHFQIPIQSWNAWTFLKQVLVNSLVLRG